MDKRFERPLSVTERLWLSVNRAYPPFANQVVIEGSGGLDYSRLKAAVERASEANPGSRLVLSGVLRKCHWVDSGVTPPVVRVDGGSWDGLGPDNAPFLLASVDYTGHTCGVVYAEGNPARIIFRSNHGVMDGMGTLTWAEDVFRVLRGEAPIGSSSTLTEYLLISSLSDKSMKMHPIESIAPTGKEARGGAGVVWKRLTFSGKQSRLMGKIAIALARSAWKYQDGVVRIGVPVDTRSRIPGLRSTGNLSMALYIRVMKDSTPDSFAAEVRRQLDEMYDCICIEGGDYMDLVPIRIMGHALKLFLRIPRLTGRHNVSAMISNLGMIDTGKYSGGGFRADTVFLIPPRMDGLPAFVVLAGAADRLEMTVSVPKALAGDGRFERLLDDISRALS